MAGAASDASYFKNLVRGQFQRISYHLNGETADNGLAHTAAPKSVSHLACYAGWPNVFSPVPVLKRVFGSGK
jgi:4-carboxymuconolactone decarboxylase